MQADAENIWAVLCGDREAFAALVARHERGLGDGLARREGRPRRGRRGAGGVSPGVPPARRPPPARAIWGLAVANRSSRVDSADRRTRTAGRKGKALERELFPGWRIRHTSLAPVPVVMTPLNGSASLGMPPNWIKCNSRRQGHRATDTAVIVYPGRGLWRNDPGRAFDLALALAQVSYQATGQVPARALVAGPGSAQELASAPSPASASSGVGGARGSPGRPRSTPGSPACWPGLHSPSPA